MQVYFHFLDIMKEIPGIRHIFSLNLLEDMAEWETWYFGFEIFTKNLNRILMTCHTMTWNWNVVCCILSNFFTIISIPLWDKLSLEEWRDKLEINFNQWELWIRAADQSQAWKRAPSNSLAGNHSTFHTKNFWDNIITNFCCFNGFHESLCRWWQGFQKRRCFLWHGFLIFSKISWKHSSQF